MAKGVNHGVPKWYRDLALSIKEHKLLDLHHPRAYRDKVVIFQPYSIIGNGSRSERGERLNTFIKVLQLWSDQGLCVEIMGPSLYYAGQTLAIVVWRPEDEELAQEIMHVMREHVGQPQRNSA